MEIINEIDAKILCLNTTPKKDFSSFEIPVIESEYLDYNHFFEKILIKNIPCIIKNVSNDWKSQQLWITNDLINLNYLDEHYGKLSAPVANCAETNFNAHCKSDMKVSEYLNYLKKRDDKVLYLKDWHLRRLKPDDSFYDVPNIFASDWLNEYAIDKEEDDFMFVYIGPENSWTPLHSDVFNSYSWSVNILGGKKWILFPPGEEEKLKDSLGNLPMVFDPNKHNNIKYYEIVQTKNDAVFVPSGWHHQVVNLRDTVSINHNWINACNIGLVWEAMVRSLQSVEREIEEFQDSPDFTSQCQLILKSLFGMNFEGFINFVVYMVKKRISQKNGTKFQTFGKFVLGENHILFDLEILLKLIENINKTLVNSPHYQKYLISTEQIGIVNTVS